MTTVPASNQVQVLRTAADYLETNGWSQREFFAWGDGDHPAACALGAIQIAVTGQPVDVFAGLCDHADLVAVQAAAASVVKHLHHVYNAAQFTSIWDPHTATWLECADPTHTLTVWNDRDGRTANEVITALREAANQHEKTAPTTDPQKALRFTRSQLIKLHNHFWTRLDDENADRQLLLEGLLGELGWLADHMDGQEDQR
jgi:hypothetical protein